MQATTYNQEGKESGTIELPESVFGVKASPDLVHQVVVAMQANRRTPVAHTKSRAEVRGGGRKPWRQKGTGRARHGSTRSPIWRTGGVTHGPRNDKSYQQTITKKMKAKALAAVLSAKFRDGEVLFLDELALVGPKTKIAAGLMQKLAQIDGFEKIAYRRGKRALIALPEVNEAVVKSFRNLKTLATDEVRNLNPLDLMVYRYLVLVSPKASIATLGARVLNK
ncbi:MAG: 50S ribosomal protein L4 [Candidatus Vogelbacteria bacterium CG10_big_fil_rev_8_21_14_0_10_51_16]|uniref:Large ribosomal subunit protein uL4 n=1 Tax=Candidatus Vogelbacteria bacterium CG10_big_fil_rev_8_21_14_0_10_51_16 TaxID=1975045 RepID=A0A2H0RDC5_9BACT|nr:MAG: 50S ribosomal protein L4 [Candidatus Vogelbacteria bacterium CG10_big_fil_rev_8_21_14_0_10_51_16]